MTAGRRTALVSLLPAGYATALAVNRALKRVTGESMRPTLAPGDVVLTVPARLLRPRRGAVVVVADPRQPSRQTLKRIVALPGARVDLDEGHLFLADTWHDEPYAPFHHGPIQHWRLGPDEYIVLGDNRAASTDSRTYGPVCGAAIRAVAVARLRPRPRLLHALPLRRAGPRVRPNVRIVLLGPGDRVLLFRHRDPHDPAALPFWYPPGGGIDAGEDAETAALRELAEETGQAGLALGPALWTRTAAETINGKPFRHVERYFLVRTQDTTVDRSGWSAFERAATIDVRWWTVDELGDTTETVYPERLAVHLRAVLATGPPAQPLDISLSAERR